MFTLTEKGRALLAKVFAGGLTLEITRVMTSSKENLENIPALEILPSEMDECDVLSKTQNGNEFVFQISLSNTQSVGNYTIHQIGIYAADPDEEEVLYGVFSLSYPFFMPSSTEVLRRYEPVLKIVFDTAPNITINIDPARMATLQDVENTKDYIDTKLEDKAPLSHNHTVNDISGTLPITKGGTGATTAAAARNALGLGNTTGAVPIANGGTGATSASAALSSLGAMPLSGGTATGQIIAQTNTSYTTSQTRNITLSTTDLTAGTSSLANGSLYVVYEN